MEDQFSVVVLVSFGGAVAVRFGWLAQFNDFVQYALFACVWLLVFAFLWTVHVIRQSRRKRPARWMEQLLSSTQWLEQFSQQWLERFAHRPAQEFAERVPLSVSEQRTLDDNLAKALREFSEVQQEEGVREPLPDSKQEPTIKGSRLPLDRLGTTDAVVPDAMRPIQAKPTTNHSRKDPLDHDEEIYLVTDADLHAASRKTKKPVTANDRIHDPLDDFVSDAELIAESRKSVVRSEVPNTRTNRQHQKPVMRAGFVVGALVLLAIGILIGEPIVRNGMQSAPQSSTSGTTQALNTTYGNLAHDGTGQSRDVRTLVPQNRTRTDASSEFSAVTADALVSNASGVRREAMRPEIPPQLTPEELFDKASQSVVRVNVRNERSNLISFGSGFFVGDDSTVITNYHVIECAYSVEVVLHDGTSLPVLGIQGVDPIADIAVLKVAHDPKQGIRHLTLGLNMLPPVGSKVYVIGAPEGLDASLSDGLVSGRRERDGRMWIQISAPISPGSSGSPVLNVDGSVIGVATWILHIEGQNLNFASPASGVSGLLANKSPIQQVSDLFLEKLEKLEAVYAKTKKFAHSKEATKIAVADAIWELDHLPASFRKMKAFWEYKGEIYFWQNQHEAALTAFRKALAIDTDASFVWQRIGDIHSIRRQFEDAVQAFGQAVKVDPKNDDLWRAFGRSLLEVNRPKEAVDALRRSIAINSKNTLAHSILGDALAELGDVEGGVAEHKIALTLQPKSYPTHFLFGMFLRKNRRHQESIKVFQNAQSLTDDRQLRFDCAEKIHEAGVLLRIP